MVNFNSQSKGRERIYRYAPLVLWIMLIFYLSSGQASSTQTSRFVRPLLEILFPAASEQTLTLYHSHVRKCAHFFVYAALSFWSWRALKDSANELLRKYNHVFSLSIVLLVAVFDEFNQSFNAARTSSAYDVALDFAGGLTIVLIIYFTRKPVNFYVEKD